MKRILAAILILVTAITISFSGTVVLVERLDDLKMKAELILQNESEPKNLYDAWVKSEKIFSLTLNEDKYKNLARHIYLLNSLGGDDLEKSCREILYEIEVIRETQRLSLENIL